MTKILPRLARKALESSGARDVGARLLHGRAAVGVLPDHASGVPPQELRRHGGPDRLLPGGDVGQWLDARYFDVDKYVDTLGSIPADMVKLGFKLLKPTMDLSTNVNLWWNLWNPEYVAGFTALNKWANEYLPFPASSSPVGEGVLPAEQARQGRARDGRAAGQSLAIACPVLAVGAKEDDIAPPACVRPLMDAVSSTDKEYLELPGGHISLIAGRGASTHCWPKVAAWLAARWSRRRAMAETGGRSSSISGSGK